LPQVSSASIRPAANRKNRNNMKIGVVGIGDLTSGKTNLFDNRIDTLGKILASPKQVYIQLEIICDNEKIKEAEGIICLESAKLDLIINDLEFVETRLDRCGDGLEKTLLIRFKEQLDKEGLLSGLVLSDEEKAIVSGYPLLTYKPVFFATQKDLEDRQRLLMSAYSSFGYISFFTSNEKEVRGWSLKKGSNAWDAAGCIHTDIQKGFIRAEVVSYQDIINDAGLSQARHNNHIRLENKDYIVCDGDYILFRFNR